MDVQAVQAAIGGFAANRQVQLSSLGSRNSQVLELAALVVVVEHYVRSGYAATPVNLQDGAFKVHLNSQGYPWNFSYWRVQRNGRTFQIHANLPVESAYAADNGIYVIDVAVLDGPELAPIPGERWRRVPNENLVTFVEVKAIVIYPMLLAQFLGIVYELTPHFLGSRRPWGFTRDDHFDPALLALGYVHARSTPIVAAYASRGIKVRIVGNCDLRVAELEADPAQVSPLK